MYVIKCRTADGPLFLEKGEFSWVDCRQLAATYPDQTKAQAVCDKVNERTPDNAWRTMARPQLVRCVALADGTVYAVEE